MTFLAYLAGFLTAVAIDIAWALFKPQHNEWLDRDEEEPVVLPPAHPVPPPPPRVDPEKFRQTAVIPPETLDRISSRPVLPMPGGKRRWRRSLNIRSRS